MNYENINTTTMLKFHHLLNDNKLGEALFAKVGQELQARGFKVSSKNRNKSKIRARVEPVFAVVKRLWGFGKVRYQGLAKNATGAFTALALANIYLSPSRLMGQVRP
jgi:IS5 family transposase